MRAPALWESTLPRRVTSFDRRFPRLQRKLKRGTGWDGAGLRNGRGVWSIDREASRGPVVEGGQTIQPGHSSGRTTRGAREGVGIAPYKGERFADGTVTHAGPGCDLPTPTLRPDPHRQRAVAGPGHGQSWPLRNEPTCPAISSAEIHEFSRFPVWPGTMRILAPRIPAGFLRGFGNKYGPAGEGESQA